MVSLNRVQVVRVLWIGVLLLSFGGLAGCSTTDESETGSGSGLADLVGEFAALEQDPDLFRIRFSDRQNYVAECMAARGFEYVQTPWDEVFAPEGFRPPGYELLRMERDEAAELGIGLTDQILGPEELTTLEEFPEPNDPASSSSALTFSVALWGAEWEGVPGCVEDASREVGALYLSEAVSLMSDVDLQVESERFARFTTDPEVVDHFSAWSSCMSEQGYSGIGDPLGEEHLAEYFSSEVLESHEIDLVGGQSIEMDDEAGAAPDDLREQVLRLEREFAVVYVECLVPVRPSLTPIWEEYLGYSPSPAG